MDSREDRGNDWFDRGIVIGGRTLTTAQAATIAASLLAAFLAILAAAGVFNGKSAAVPPLALPLSPRTVTVTAPTSNPTPPASVPSQTLSPGATGQQVKTLQRALTALGFSPGKPDGVYGPSTQKAVEKFQAARGLPKDGVVGQQTLAALQQDFSG